MLPLQGLHNPIFSSKFIRRIWLLCFPLTIFGPSALSQIIHSNSQWSVIDYGLEQGLEYKNVTAFVIDKKGIAWVGHEQGLKIFDGKKLYPASNYLKSSVETLELPVEAIIYDSIVNCLYVFAFKRPGTLVYTIHLDKMNTHSNALKEHTQLFGTLNSPPLYVNNKIICNSGDFPTILIFDQVNLIKKLENFNVYSRHHFVAGDGHVYFDDVDQTKLYRAKIDEDGLHLILVEHLNSNDYHNLFKTKGVFISSKGFHYQNIALQKQLRLAKQALEFGLRKEYYIEASYEQDLYGNYYMYGPQGLQKIIRKLSFIEGINTPNETRTIIYNNYNNIFYVGTPRGVCFVNRKSKDVKEIASHTKDRNYYCCAQTIQDSMVVFFGSDKISNQLFLNKRNNKFWTKPAQTNLRIWNIHKFGKTTYYCTDRGLYTGTYTNGLFSFQHIDIGIKDELYDILSLSEQEYLLAGKRGLYQYNAAKMTIRVIIAGEFLCLEKFKDYIIAGSAKKGVLLFDRKMILLKTINEGNGLKSNAVFSMLTDKSLNALWIGSGSGLTVYHLPTGICKTYTTADGLLHNEFNRTSTYKFKGDSLFMMGGIVGLNYIQNKLPFSPPGTVVASPGAWAIETIYSDQETEKNWIDIYHPDILKLKSRVNKITIKIARNTTEFLYATAYRLNDKTKWEYVSAGEDIEILSPQSGIHYVTLKTIMADGRESKTIRIPIEIEAEWYGKPWGIALIVFLVLMLLIPIFWIRDYFQKQKSERLVNKNKEKLFSIIGHDLRSPIKSYQSLSETINYLIEKKDWETIKSVSENIDKTGKEIDLMLENLLNWSLLEQKELKPIKQLFNVAEISESIVELYKVIASQKNIKILLSISPETAIQSDRNLLNLILRNLIDNAVKNAVEFSTIELLILVSNNKLNIEIGNYFNPVKSTLVESFAKNILSPNKTEGRGIGHKFILQSVQLLNGQIAARILKNEHKISITITIPGLK